MRNRDAFSMLSDGFLNFNFVLSIIATIIVFLCSLTILHSYLKLRLRPILLYFFGIFFLVFGTLGMSVGALELSESFVKQFQSITFPLSWLGIYFLYLAIKSSKGSIFSIDTNLISGLTGAIITAYITQDFYEITWNPITQIWMFNFHPVLMVLLLISIIFIVYELISFVRIIASRTRHPKVKRNLKIYFLGWILVGSCGFFFGISAVVPEIPDYFYLVFFSAGLSVISLAVSLFPSSLIATTSKIYNVGFLDANSGLSLLFYDFWTGTLIDPLLFSGIMTAINKSLTESVKGSRYLKILDIGSRKILIERGFNIQAIMIVEKESRMMTSLLKRLLLLFELKYFDAITTIPTCGVNTETFLDFLNTIETYTSFAL